MITGGGNVTTWALQPTPPAPAVSTAPVIPPATQLSFLGYGITTPFRRGAGNDFAAATGSDILKSRASQILGVGCSSKAQPGELLWRGEFGVRLRQLRHRTKTLFLSKMAQHYVMDAFARWEPNIRTSVAGAVPNPAKPRSLLLRVGYDIVTTSQPSNRVVLPGESLDVPIAPTAG